MRYGEWQSSSREQSCSEGVSFSAPRLALLGQVLARVWPSLVLGEQLSGILAALLSASTRLGVSARLGV